MRATVNQDTCISCGMCIDICPDIFSYNSEGKSSAIDDDIPETEIDSAQEAADACPVDAIELS